MDSQPVGNNEDWKPVIPALDTDDLGQACEWVEKLRGSGPRIFKVGSQLFTRVGPKAVELVLERGCGVFLDLKFHDIPNTVAQAARAAVTLGVTMFNVHASGGKRMMEAAVHAAQEETLKRGLPRVPWVLAVTVLTSLEREDLGELGLKEEVSHWVAVWSQAALRAGVNGIVSSPRELAMLRQKYGQKILLVTPGIRTAQRNLADDQRRVSDPSWALEQGADHLVMGRGLLESPDPLQFLKKIEGDSTTPHYSKPVDNTG